MPPPHPGNFPDVCYLPLECTYAEHAACLAALSQVPNPRSLSILQVHGLGTCHVGGVEAPYAVFPVKLPCLLSPGGLCAKANMARAVLAHHSFTLAYAPKLSLFSSLVGVYELQVRTIGGATLRHISMSHQRYM